MRWLVAPIVLLSAPRPPRAGLAARRRFVQGGLVRGQVPPGSEVRFAGRELQLDPDGRFLFGFGRDEASGRS